MADCYLTIIGGGIVGMAIAHEISTIVDNQVICLLERNKHFPGENQTSRNSGVIHAGIYYDRSHSPLKARLCVEGNELLYQFCWKYHLPVKQTGKLVVAVNPEEDRSLDNILLRSQENGVPGIRKINSAESKELEPNVRSYSALWVPTSGIVDPISVVRKLRELSSLKEYFLVGTEILDLKPGKEEFVVEVLTQSKERYAFSTKYVINAAGLYSDEVARMVNPEFPLKILPLRGEFAKFYQSKGRSIYRNVYPLPSSYLKPDGSQHLTVGVHLTPTFTLEKENASANHNDPFPLGTEVIVGPLNIKSGNQIKEESFGSDLAPTSKFLEKICSYFPNIDLDDLHLHQTGIQAVLENSQDFHIAPDQIYPRMINAVGICSPGLTSSLAIAKMVKNLLSGGN